MYIYLYKGTRRQKPLLCSGICVLVKGRWNCSYRASAPSVLQASCIPLISQCEPERVTQTVCSHPPNPYFPSSCSMPSNNGVPGLLSRGHSEVCPALCLQHHSRLFTSASPVCMFLSSQQEKGRGDTVTSRWVTYPHARHDIIHRYSYFSTMMRKRLTPEVCMSCGSIFCVTVVANREVVRIGFFTEKQ